jgi:hypothetical protein
MDYPQLNLLFGLALLFTVVINIGLRVLLSKVGLSGWMSSLSWIALTLSILAALYIEILFLRLMTPAFNLQLGLGLLIIGGIGDIVFASLYRKVSSARLAGILFTAQMLVSLVSLIVAFGLYRSLVPISPSL